MQDEQDHDLQARIDALLAGRLGREETDEILLRIAREDGVREILRESIDLRDRSRAAFGYDGADEAMRDSMAAVIASLKPDRRAGLAASVSRGGALDRKRGVRPAPAVLAAAAVMVTAVAVYLAVLSHRDNRMLRRELAEIRASLSFPDITRAEREGYRRIWSTIAEDGNGPAPWIVLSENGGEFGYLPETPGSSSRQCLILVRFLMATPDGRRVAAVNVLIPAGRDLRLSVPEAAQVAGLPVSCDIATNDDWAAVGLSVGKQKVGNVGVRGRVSVGRSWLEIGEFLLDGQRMRVAVQALPLEHTLG